ncbi:MAG TPA: hypothetical protein VMS65_11910, partial [Polyangiaceae bacterium]|nr:hypothetical protein [Polyangiaceae bacterium]
LRNADTVSIARRLAERIQRVRQQQRASGADVRRSSFPPERPRSESGDTPKAPSLRTPTVAPPVTRTFAAREEIVVWTRRLSSAPPGLDAPRASAPAPSTPSSRAGRFPVGAMRAAVFGAFGLVAIVAAGFALSSGRADSAVRPVDAGAVVAPRVAPPSPVADTLAEEVTAAKLPVAPESEAPKSPAPVPATRHSSTLLPALSPSGRPAAPASSGAPDAPLAPVASGTLRLTADPPAVVSVEGDGFQQTSSTPVRGLSLRPGAYRITFRNETYGSPVATRVVLEPGGERSVHADFRAAEPRITQR